MTVACRDAVSVVDVDGASVTAEKVGEGDDTVGRCNHWTADPGGDVHARVKRAFSVKWIDTLAKRTGNLAFHRPQVGSRICANPVGVRRVPRQAERNANAGRARELSILQCIKLVKRRVYLRILDLLGRGGDHHRIGLETIKRGNFAGQRSERCHLNIAFLGDQLQARITVFELFLLRAELVVVRNLAQYSRISAGNAGQAQRADRHASQKNIEILNGNG